MNCESTVFSRITTRWLPLCVTDAMFEPSRNMPTMSIALSCCPAFRV